MTFFLSSLVIPILQDSPNDSKKFFYLTLNSDFVKIEITTIHIHNATYTLQRENRHIFTKKIPVQPVKT
jgi:hypothetical protein